MCERQVKLLPDYLETVPMSDLSANDRAEAIAWARSDENLSALMDQFGATLQRAPVRFQTKRNHTTGSAATVTSRTLVVESPEFVAEARWAKSATGWVCTHAGAGLEWMIGLPSADVGAEINRRGWAYSWRP